MMSPIAAGYMVGRLLFDARIGPVVELLDRFGIQYSFFETGPRAVPLLIMVNAWVWIPFVLVMLLAGLQAMPGEVFEAARIDGASRWQLFRDMTFPLLLPVSLTAVLLRVIFEFKIVDIIQVVTGGGPGSASETVTYYVYQEGYLGGNIGYATAMAQVFLVIIIAFVTVLLVTVCRSGARTTATVRTHSKRRSPSFYIGRTMTYATLLLRAFVSIFPIYWTVVTSLKNLRLITTGPYFSPWIDSKPITLGWTVLTEANDRQEFTRIFTNSLVIAVSVGLLALLLGALAGYGLARFDYKFAIWRNRQISFWFVSQLILPPAAVIMPILILYRQLHLLDSRLGLVILYTVANLPIVIWTVRDQFNSIPVELEQAVLVDGSTLFGAFARIVVPIAGPGIVAAFILVVIFSWNEYFFAANLSTVDAVTLPSKIAAEVSAQGAKYRAMAAIASSAIAPLIVVGILLERYVAKGLTAGAVK